MAGGTGWAGRGFERSAARGRLSPPRGQGEASSRRDRSRASPPACGTARVAPFCSKCEKEITTAPLIAARGHALDA
eukprot:2193279-Prymnesium_polylepis.1